MVIIMDKNAAIDKLEPIIDYKVHANVNTGPVSALITVLWSQMGLKMYPQRLSRVRFISSPGGLYSQIAPFALMRF